MTGYERIKRTLDHKEADRIPLVLAWPWPETVDYLNQLEGNIMVIGATGKIGPSITRCIKRAVDALETLATNPVQYLVMPRVVAAAVMLPTLTALENVEVPMRGQSIRRGERRARARELSDEAVSALDRFGGKLPREPAAAERHSGAWVSPGFLEVLRVDPLLGRGHGPVVVDCTNDHQIARVRKIHHAPYLPNALLQGSCTISSRILRRIGQQRVRSLHLPGVQISLALLPQGQRDPIIVVAANQANTFVVNQCINHAGVRLLQL